MCWSFEASFTFSFIGMVFTYHMLRNRNKYNLVDVVTTAFYTVMELTQLIQYLYIKECTPMNYYLTVFIHFLLWVQPFMANFYGYCETKQNKAVFSFAMIMSFVVLIISFVQLFLGEHCPSCGKVYNMVNVGNATCTTMGRIHLQWQFNYASMQGFNANWLVYSLLIFLPNIYHSEAPSARPLNWLFPLLLAIIMVGEFNNEIYAIWCAYTIPYGIYLIMRELSRKLLRNGTEKN